MKIVSYCTLGVNVVGHSTIFASLDASGGIKYPMGWLSLTASKAINKKPLNLSLAPSLATSRTPT